ncbi:low temperature requirement protein LtrA [Glaciihabitans tibetensis]|uniref:Low temperature requirement protein LtrA n=2 Tax=Glaciihabitans tibetensis TaxID=1266600 RepID=A0A2T0VCE6_9MICO|nr:low temperature requirement protein LtrA [Glaciihabitans tibetensis]
MVARSQTEPHRASSPLELLFDLTFVVAIAQIAAELAHGIADGHAGEVLVPYLMVFFAIWWAWVTCTWFASAYDTDDVPYRVLTMVQMAGVLTLAAGVPTAFAEGNFIMVVMGYVIMRIGLVAQWLRVAIEHPAGRATALRYAGGIAVVQVGWLLRQLLPEGFGVASFAVLVAFELAVPIWAARKGEPSWHPHHIAERYGLFTIIVLGESVFAATTGVQAAVQNDGLSAELVAISLSGLVLLFALWWLYFLEPAADGLAARRHRAYFWGYGHYGVFASLAALGAGLEVAVEYSGHHLDVSALVVGFALAIPVALFLVLLWAIHAPVVEQPVIRPAVILPAAALVLAMPLLTAQWGVGPEVIGIALVCVLVIALTIASRAKP